METANHDEINDDSDIERKVTAQIIEQELEEKKNYQQVKSSPSLPNPVFTSQIQCMQEEILHLRAQVALLQSELACRDYVNEKVTTEEDCEDQNCTDCKNEENDKSNYASDDLCETADIFDVVQQQQTSTTAAIQEHELNELSQLSISQCQPAATPKQTKLRQNNSKPPSNTFEPKIAERVKLKRAMEDDHHHVTGSDFIGNDVG